MSKQTKRDELQKDPDQMLCDHIDQLVLELVYLKAGQRPPNSEK